MKRTAVLNVVGLTESLIGFHMPNIAAFAARNQLQQIRPAFPAVTCTAQSTYLTGVSAREHGIVGNGWYFRDLAEVLFWRQSNRLVRGRRIYDVARERFPA